MDTDETAPRRAAPDPTLMAPDTGWWAKIGNAERHRDRLIQACEDFRDQRPFYVEAEPTNHPNRTAYRLHLTMPIPVEISLIVGDLLHNLRSALDSLVYELTKRAVGRDLTEREEKACQFPISPDPESFDEFFTGHKRRDAITPQYLRNAIRWPQTFYWLEDGKKLKIESIADLDYADQHRNTNLAALNHLSNLDKHRRLAVMAWWPDIVYWTTDGESNRRFQPGDGTFDDGSIVGYVTGTDEGHPEVVYEFGLTLADLQSDRRATRDDVVKLTKGWIFTTQTALTEVIQGWAVATQASPAPPVGSP